MHALNGIIYNTMFLMVNFRIYFLNILPLFGFCARERKLERRGSSCPIVDSDKKTHGGKRKGKWSENNAKYKLSLFSYFFLVRHNTFNVLSFLACPPSLCVIALRLILIILFITSLSFLFIFIFYLFWLGTLSCVLWFCILFMFFVS